MEQIASYPMGHRVSGALTGAPPQKLITNFYETSTMNKAR